MFLWYPFCMKKEKRSIPKKFQKANKSFVDRVYKEEEVNASSSFSAFPKKMSFYGKDSDEEIVLIVRRHWIAYVPDVLIVFFVLLLPFLLTLFSGAFPILGTRVLYIGMMIMSVGIASSLLLTTFLKWYYTIHIVTDQRIVVIKMTNALYHSYSEAQLEKIEDITHEHIGFIGTFFDVGNLSVDTAGHEVDFKLSMLPRPREMQDILNDLLEMKQKGEI